MPDELHPVRSVRIEGQLARGFVGFLKGERPDVASRTLGPIDLTPQFRTVKDADDADRELGNPGDQHHCPLCNEFFGWEAFKAHAPQCIQARAPRERIWVPAGTPNAITAYKDSIPVERF